MSIEARAVREQLQRLQWTMPSRLEQEEIGHAARRAEQAAEAARVPLGLELTPMMIWAHLGDAAAMLREAAAQLDRVAATYKPQDQETE
jgi:hypothetical protein